MERGALPCKSPSQRRAKLADFKNQNQTAICSAEGDNGPMENIAMEGEAAVPYRKSDATERVRGSDDNEGNLAFVAMGPALVPANPNTSKV